MKNLIYCIGRARYLYIAHEGSKLERAEASLSGFERSVLNNYIIMMITLLKIRKALLKFRIKMIKFYISHDSELKFVASVSIVVFLLKFLFKTVY